MAVRSRALEAAPFTERYWRNSAETVFRLSTIHAPHGPSTPCTPARSGRRTRGAVRKIGPRRRGRGAVARLNISSYRARLRGRCTKRTLGSCSGALHVVEIAICISSIRSSTIWHRHEHWRMQFGAVERAHCVLSAWTSASLWNWLQWRDTLLQAVRWIGRERDLSIRVHSIDNS